MNTKSDVAPPRIVVAGAGSIGCFTGGLWTAAGRNVTLLARPRIVSDIAANGLTLTDYGNLSHTLTAAQLDMSTTPDCLGDADLIIVTVKTNATAEIAELIAQNAPPTSPIISFQNGLEACAILRQTLPNHDIRAAMVPFNVVPKGPGHYHRATSGDIVIEAGDGAIHSTLYVPGLPVTDSDNIIALQWGKLLINLTNALNALSGLTLRDMLMSRPWRHLMADQMEEALGILKTAQIPVKSTSPLPATMIPHVLRLPTWAFTRIAAQMLTIDPTARTSMAYDLAAKRPTEIASLQGAIIALAQTHGKTAPICARVAQAIRDAEGQGVPGLAPQDLA